MKCLRNESAEDEIYGIIEEWAAGKLLAEIEALAKHHGFGALPVENAEDAYSQPLYEERGEIQQINDPWYGSLKTQDRCPYTRARRVTSKWLASRSAGTRKMCYGGSAD